MTRFQMFVARLALLALVVACWEFLPRARIVDPRLRRSISGNV